MDGSSIDAGALGVPVTEASPAVVQFGQAAADLRLLARLHDREPTAELLEELREQPLQVLFGLTPDRPDATQAIALIAEVVSDLPHPIDATSLNDLAADFASIHTTNAYRACPTESAWMGEEPSRRLETLSRLTAWRQRLGLDDDPRGPDHLVAELRCLAALLECAGPWDAAAFLDQHPLRWLPAFCGHVAARCRTPYFAGVALLTSAYLDHLRALLERSFGLPRSSDERRANERKGASARKPGFADPWGQD